MVQHRVGGDLRTSKRGLTIARQSDMSIKQIAFIDNSRSRRRSVKPEVHKHLPAALLFAGALMALGGLPVGAQIAVKNQGYVPFSEEPINYRSEVHDPVAKLQ